MCAVKYQTKKDFWEAVEIMLGKPLDNELKEIIYASLHDAAIHVPFSEGDVEYTVQSIKRLWKYFKDE